MHADDDRRISDIAIGDTIKLEYSDVTLLCSDREESQKLYTLYLNIVLRRFDEEVRENHQFRGYAYEVAVKGGYLAREANMAKYPSCGLKGKYYKRYKIVERYVSPQAVPSPQVDLTSKRDDARTVELYLKPDDALKSDCLWFTDSFTAYSLFK